MSPSLACDIPTFVGQVKNLVQRAAWSQGTDGVFWQRSFWDQFVRADESLERTVLYVLNNPVRAGIVQDWRDYRYGGSLALDL